MSFIAKPVIIYTPTKGRGYNPRQRRCGFCYLEENMNFNKHFYALAFLMILSISLPTVAEEETDEVIRMEEVVVTARKREQRSFEVPLSVSTLQGERFDTLRSSGMDVRFLSNRTPSFQMESSCRVRFLLYNSVEYADDWLLEGGVRLACLLPHADVEVAIIGRNILNDTSPTGGIDFNNLTGYVNEPRFWSLEAVRRF